MITKQLEVLNELGFHARVASRIVREAKNFECSIAVEKDGKSYNLKNVTGIITANVKAGDIVTVLFDGADEAAAAYAMEILFNNKFGEK